MRESPRSELEESESRLLKWGDPGRDRHGQSRTALCYDECSRIFGAYRRHGLDVGQLILATRGGEG
jgi:hypothetical protein